MSLIPNVPQTTIPRKMRSQIGSSKPNLNIYDVKNNPEWELAESYVTEYTDIAGIECIYYPRSNSVEPDDLYGEVQDAEYTEGKTTKILYEVGEVQTLYSMFGMLATDQIIAHIPQAVFVRDVSETELPKPGDVIQIPWYTYDFTNDEDATGGRTFEIIHVAQDQAIFQLHSLVYVLYLKPYRFSEESDSARRVSSDLDDISTNTSLSISAYGDNDWIDTQSEALSAYDGVDKSIYGF